MHPCKETELSINFYLPGEQCTCCETENSGWTLWHWEELLHNTISIYFKSNNKILKALCTPSQHCLLLWLISDAWEKSGTKSQWQILYQKMNGKIVSCLLQMIRRLKKVVYILFWWYQQISYWASLCTAFSPNSRRFLHDCLIHLRTISAHALITTLEKVYPDFFFNIFKLPLRSRWNCFMTI